MGSRSKRNRRQQTNTGLARHAPRPQQRMTDPLAIVQQQVLHHSWQGPIPSPEDLGRYREVDPSLPDRILTMAERTLALTEKQTDHRIAMETKLLTGMNFRAHAGLWLAFTLAVLIFVGCGWLINNGHDIAGSVIATIDLVGLVGVFIYGRHDQRAQEQQK